MKRTYSVIIAVLCCGIAVLLYMGKLTSEAPAIALLDGEKVKIGVILVSPKLDGGWSEAHYNGFEEAKRRMKNIEVIYVENVFDQDRSIVAAVDQLAGQGVKIIFATSFDYGTHLQECAGKYPDIKFFHATGYLTAKNLATYFGRIYQARYLTGIVAGLQTKTNHVAYVAAYPIPEVVRGINAFALGARSVNPDVVVHVDWTYAWNRPDIETTVTNRLMDRFPIDVMAQHQNTINPVQAAANRGIFAIGYNLDRAKDFPNTFLTAPVWNWGPFYEARLGECFTGRFEGKGYLDSIGDNMLDIAPLTPLVKAGAQEKVDAAKKRLISKTWDVFYGPIRDQSGNLRVKKGENMTDAEMFGTFDWFVEGIEGEIKK